jgi:ATP synthase protein I
VLGGLHAGISAFAGGFAAVAGGFAGARVASGSNKKDNNQPAGIVLVRLLKGEAVKIAIIALVLLLVFKFYSGLVPLALILGLAGAALMSGAAIFSINQKSNL